MNSNYNKVHYFQNKLNSSFNIILLIEKNDLILISIKNFLEILIEIDDYKYQEYFNITGL